MSLKSFIKPLPMAHMFIECMNEKLNRYMLPQPTKMFVGDGLPVNPQLL